MLAQILGQYKMKVNFEIKDNSALTLEGRHIDLHNNFDFIGFDYNVAGQELKLNWTKSSGECVDKNELSSLVLTHKQVTYFTISDKDENSKNQDDICLGEISFFPSTSREINDSIIPQEKPNEGDDILYFFENGQQIRTHCEEVEVSIIENQELNITLTKDEALVLFEFLSRFNEKEQKGIFEDQAEEKTLWLVEGQLEKQLSEPFMTNYEDIIDNARNKVRDEE